jgi:hypothetical protein
VLLAIALVVAAVLYVWPRTLDLDRVVTVDEPVFLGMSANFSNALAHRQFARTNQFLYPAVPIMWAGAAGFFAELPNYPREHPAQIEPPFDYVLTTVDRPIRAVGGDPLAVLIAARLAKIALQAAIFLVAVWLLQRLFGGAVAALTAALICFDPFLIPHDQLLHVDGLTGIAAFAAMLAAADADRNLAGKGRWALAAALAAICWLTRLTGLVLLPIILLTVTSGAIVRWRRGDLTGRAAARLAVSAAGVIVAAGAATTFALWPALWVDPVGTVQSLATAWRAAAATPHPFGLYFAGRTIRGDPGALFYLVVALYKLTPFTLFSLVAVAAGFAWRIDAIAPERFRRPVAILTTFVAVYSLGMALGMRKFDRYILPDLPLFDLLAAIGIVGLARFVWTRRQVAWRFAASTAVAGLATGQAALAMAQRPYFLAYDNPLFGGPRVAEQVLMLGWGEGLDQAAAFIRSQPGGDEAVVETSLPPTLLNYFVPPTVATRSLTLDPNVETGQRWGGADYAVTHVLEWNRDTFGPAIPYLARFDPVYTVRIDGVDFVRVYDLRRIPPPAWLADQRTTGGAIAGRIDLP